MLSAVLVSALCGLASSLVLRVGDTERACFTEDLPDRTRLLVVYRTRLYDEQRDEYLPVDPDLEMNVVATDPDEQMILSRSHGSEGHLRLLSWRPGRHQICLQLDSSQRPLPAGVKLALQLDIKVGDCNYGNAKIAAGDEPTDLQLRVRLLTEQLYQIQREQDDYRLKVNASCQLDLSITWWVGIRTLYLAATITLFIVSTLYFS